MGDEGLAGERQWKFGGGQSVFSACANVTKSLPKHIAMHTVYCDSIGIIRLLTAMHFLP